MGYISEATRQAHGNAMKAAMDKGADSATVAEFGVKLAELEIMRAAERMRESAYLLTGKGNLENGDWGNTYEGQVLERARKAYEDYRLAMLNRQRELDAYGAAQG